MAAAAAAQLLDELMGRDRNRAPTDKKRELHWDDGQVCKHYLVKFCPNELFINTRADLGPCDKLHDDSLKKEYEASSRFQRMGFEEDFLKFCQGMLADVERRIRRGKQRLSLGGQDGAIATPAQVQNNEDQIRILTERVNGLLLQVESLGCEGKVEEAQGIVKLCEQLKEERETLRRANENSHWMQTAEIAAAQEKQMEVCEVCGAFLIVGDAQQRVDDHLMGKQHVGYAKIKAAYEEIMDKRQKTKEEREKLREKEREERLNKRKEVDRQREKEVEERRKRRDDERRKDRDRRRSRSRDRRRSRSRDRRRTSRSRSRDRRQSDSRSRSHRRSSVRDRRRSRSNSRSYDRKRSRRSHSRSRSRDKRRSRDHDQKSEKDTKKQGRESQEADTRKKERGSEDRNSVDDARKDGSCSPDSRSRDKGTVGSSDGDAKMGNGDSGDAGDKVLGDTDIHSNSSSGDGKERNGSICEGDSEQ